MSVHCLIDLVHGFDCTYDPSPSLKIVYHGEFSLISLLGLGALELSISEACPGSVWLQITPVYLEARLEQDFGMVWAFILGKFIWASRVWFLAWHKSVFITEFFAYGLIDFFE